MRIHLARVLTLLALVAFAVPVWAHSESTRLTLSHPATIGSTTLKPGKYKLVAHPNTHQVAVQRYGKLIATVGAKDVTLSQKSPYTAVVFNGRKIHELQFQGKTQAMKVD